MILKAKMAIGHVKYDDQRAEPGVPLGLSKICLLFCQMVQRTLWMKNVLNADNSR